MQINEVALKLGIDQGVAQRVAADRRRKLVRLLGPGDEAEEAEEAAGGEGAQAKRRRALVRLPRLYLGVRGVTVQGMGRPGPQAGAAAGAAAAPASAAAVPLVPAAAQMALVVQGGAQQLQQLQLLQQQLRARQEQQQQQQQQRRRRRSSPATRARVLAEKAERKTARAAKRAAKEAAKAERRAAQDAGTYTHKRRRRAGAEAGSAEPGAEMAAGEPERKRRRRRKADEEGDGEGADRERPKPRQRRTAASRDGAGPSRTRSRRSAAGAEATERHRSPASASASGDDSGSEGEGVADDGGGDVPRLPSNAAPTRLRRLLWTVSEDRVVLTEYVRMAVDSGPHVRLPWGSRADTLPYTPKHCVRHIRYLKRVYPKYMGRLDELLRRAFEFTKQIRQEGADRDGARKQQEKEAEEEQKGEQGDADGAGEEAGKARRTLRRTQSVLKITRAIVSGRGSSAGRGTGAAAGRADADAADAAAGAAAAGAPATGEPPAAAAADDGTVAAEAGAAAADTVLLTAQPDGEAEDAVARRNAVLEADRDAVVQEALALVEDFVLVIPRRASQRLRDRLQREGGLELGQLLEPGVTEATLKRRAASVTAEQRKLLTMASDGAASGTLVATVLKGSPSGGGAAATGQRRGRRSMAAMLPLASSVVVIVPVMVPQLARPSVVVTAAMGRLVSILYLVRSIGGEWRLALASPRVVDAFKDFGARFDADTKAAALKQLQLRGWLAPVGARRQLDLSPHFLSRLHGTDLPPALLARCTTAATKLDQLLARAQRLRRRLAEGGGEDMDVDGDAVAEAAAAPVAESADVAADPERAGFAAVERTCTVDPTRGSVVVDTTEMLPSELVALLLTRQAAGRLEVLPGSVEMVPEWAGQAATAGRLVTSVELLLQPADVASDPRVREAAAAACGAYLMEHERDGPGLEAVFEMVQALEGLLGAAGPDGATWEQLLSRLREAVRSGGEDGNNGGAVNATPAREASPAPAASGDIEALLASPAPAGGSGDAAAAAGAVSPPPPTPQAVVRLSAPPNPSDVALVLSAFERHGMLRRLGGWDAVHFVSSEHCQAALVLVAADAKPTGLNPAAAAAVMEATGGGEPNAQPAPPRERLLRPWCDHLGRPNAPLWCALAQRLLGLVMRHPGIPEPLLVAQMDVMPPQATREALAQLVSHGRLQVRAAPPPPPPRRPALLGGGGRGPAVPAAAGAGAAASQPVVHYFPSLSHLCDDGLLRIPLPP
ncbi:hypothetical protein GPECTOR_8g273 [Gonium pectorale]|uniref:B-block binding subunit of TFIIIC domain-containing protein n=1 Tax=Gonium pectorale TaxID=33097 RepID=A0A150GSV3_GONPE|nr:hypothetical protein GPECTOR_8g273 [Gonium pectorale]|eukprot:KXZ52893.1 hypothetical protein GPECTOR_8g273 [Gonium pectorale]